METTLRLLDDALRANFYSVAFPEVAVHVLSQLQSFVKKVKVKTWGNKARSIANAVKRQSAKVRNPRSTVIGCCASHPYTVATRLLRSVQR